MKRLAFAVGVLALGFVATAPAHADFAIVKFRSGYCRIGITPLWRLRMATSCGGVGITTGITGCRLSASPITSCTRRLLGIAAITGGKQPASLEAKPAAGHRT